MTQKLVARAVVFVAFMLLAACVIFALLVMPRPITLLNPFR